MIPQEIQNGRGLTPDNYNSLVRTVMANRIAPGNGYTVLQSPRGVSLAIAQRGGSGGGGSTAVCPFQVTTANEGNNWKFKIEFGLIAGKIPTGMFAGGVPPLIMEWTDGWILAAVTFIADQVNVDAVSFEVHETIPANSETIAYYPIAYISTDATGESPTQVIQNLCSTPIPSVCDLLFVPPAS